MTAKNRCAWAEDAAFMRAYHDEAWGVPQRNSRMLWEMLMLGRFQAGLAWIIILQKREAFRTAFATFDPEKVARFGARDITRLMGDAGAVSSSSGRRLSVRGCRLLGLAAITRRAVAGALRPADSLFPKPEPHDREKERRPRANQSARVRIDFSG